MKGSRFQHHADHLQSESDARKVFADPSQRRRRWMRWAVLFLLLFIPVWGGAFLQDTVSWSSLKQDFHAYFPRAVQDLDHENDHLHGNSRHDQMLMSANASTVDGPATTCGQVEAPPYAAMADSSIPRRVFAHVPSDLAWAHLSLDESCDTVGVIVPDWITVNQKGSDFSVAVMSEDSRMGVTDYSQGLAEAPAFLPTIKFNTDDNIDYFTDVLLQPGSQAELVSEIRRALIELNAIGGCFDFNHLNEEVLLRLNPLFDAAQEDFSQAGLQSCIVLQGDGNVWKNRVFVQGFDKVVLKLFQQPWVGSSPGPLASDIWFAETATQARDIIGANRLVAAIGNFAVDWVSGQPTPQTIPYPEAMHRISRAEADLRFSANTSNSYSSFRDDQGALHKLWMLDAASARNQLIMLQNLGIQDVAVWSAGREDPGIWNVFASNSNDFDTLAADLAIVRFDNYVQYYGDGAFLKIQDELKAGLRTVEFDPLSGRVTNQFFSVYPNPYSITRYGKPEAKKLVLTFDDGPDRETTLPILDTLRDMGVPAAFFIVGSSVMNEPDLVERMVDEGHEIGSHTFSHPEMQLVSAARAELELSLLSKAVAGITGLGMTLYREPFQRSGGPIRADRVTSLKAAQDAGYHITGMDVSSHDWEGLSAQQIVDTIIEQVESGAGNIVLLHDGGLDRSATVAAVPMLITELRARGYEFTSLSDLLGLSRETLMPASNHTARVLDRISFAAVSTTQKSVMWIFWIVLSIGLLRSGGVLVLSFLRRPNRPIMTSNQPKVSVIIPAFNEEKVIEQCINSVLRSDYPNFEVIIVDDGSTDNTLNKVLKFKHKPNVRLVMQPNQGKWAALNRAILGLDTDIAVCIDADTQICRNSITRLVGHFSNPKVGAVAGKIIVGNRHKLLTRLQSLEYSISQNMDRKAYDLFNGMLVVPGALGAWRVQALRDGGLFRKDTMTEDSDLTISVNRAGYRIIYDEYARAYTEAPERVHQLLTQRLRWSLGMLQSAWKHKNSVLERRSIGLVSIPDMFIFGYIFPILAPIADILVLALMVRFYLEGASAASPELLWAYLTLPILELALAFIALLRDRDESLWSLCLWPAYRVLYRPLLYYSVIRSITRAVSGRLANWGKLNRQGRDYSQVTQVR
ncbi:glycosyltransferase [Parasedimentitalea marina]|uniref:Chitooligosaccharide deacetylase n=1 Tax=Parasedimentitalea marina TaxID=2483033 RepID=A0A3T0MZH4_9RHOB|nr:glycosyltransferase [Parasedimentitalea marina]AZV77142.1 glycosyltransferase [Parasedimentitalea marina]